VPNDDTFRMRVYYEQLHTLLAQVAQTEPEKAELIGTGSGLPQLVHLFNGFLERISRAFASDPLVFELIQDVKPLDELRGTRASSSRAHLAAKTYLTFSINGVLQILGAKLNLAAGVPANVSIDREGLFVAGQKFDALLAASRILGSARRSIRLVDGYIGGSVLDLMSIKEKPAVVQIITKASTLPGNFVTLAIAFNTQYGALGALSVRTSDAFHDRFLVIDENDFYHFGASLKDLGARGFMFSRLEEPSVIRSLKQTIESEWDKAAILI
jgi:hypothetical protein